MQRINQYDTNGNKHGYWEEMLDSTTTLHSKGNYIHGYRDGNWEVYYYDSDAIWYRGKFSNGIPKELVEEFHSDGRIKECLFFIKD